MNIENILVTEIERQGLRASSSGLLKMFVDVVGRVEGPSIIFDGKSLSIRDYIKSVHHDNPDWFVPREPESSEDDPESFASCEPSEDHAENHGYSGLTAKYIEENRRMKHSGNPESTRYTGKTLEMMNEIIASRRGVVR